MVKTHLPAGVPKNKLDYAIVPNIALFPTLWRKIMNPQVHTWRNMYYPEIQDWRKYNEASNPAPRIA